MSDYTLNLTNNLYQYYRTVSLREPSVLQALREQTRKMSMAQMQISPEQGQFMSLLIEILQAKKTLDIGVFTGYSALVVALALPDEGKVIACDRNGEWTKIAKKYWEMAKVSQKIDLKIGIASETLNSLIKEGQGGTFDFSFIDADKKNYPLYYEQSLELLRVGGLIAIDNVLWRGKVADPTIGDPDTQILRELNLKLLKDERISLSVLPIGDGLTLARKK